MNDIGDTNMTDTDKVYGLRKQAAIELARLVRRMDVVESRVAIEKARMVKIIADG